MQEIVVAKLIRLGKNGDSFDKKLVAQVMRTNAKVSKDYIEQFNATWQDRGQLYIIDEEKTKERNEKLISKEEVKTNDAELSIREALKKEADELGIEYAKNISNEKLAEKISNYKQNG